MVDVRNIQAVRQKVWFRSGGDACAAWHYPGTNAACVVMAGGFAVTKEPGTDRFAQRFNDAGFSVLAFDYRRLGESGGRPRQVVRIREQLADWHAAIDCAATLPEVDRDRIAIWGFSASGGHVFRVAARNARVAAAIAQTPNADGIAASRNAARHQKTGALMRFTGRGLRDASGRVLRRPPVLVPLVGQPGAVAVLTTPDVRDTNALDPNGEYADWQQTVAAASALRLGFYRPGRAARHMQRPLLVVVSENDETALAAPSVRAAKRAPRADLVTVPGGHYAPFLDQHETVVDAELSFLRRTCVDKYE
jgi:pimeloyl-ACP methyl ester carboxylesterase